MKKIFFYILFFAPLATYAQPRSLTRTVIRYDGITDSVAARAANDALHAQGKADMMFNTQANPDHWDIWNGSSYDCVFDFNSGSGGGDLPGVYVVTLNGLVGDGTTIENSALDALISSVPSGSTLYFPIDKIYQLNATVTITDKIIHLEGGGIKSHIRTAVGNIDLIKFVGDDCSHSSVRNLFINNTVTTPTSGSGLFFDEVGAPFLEGLYVNNFYRDVFFNDCFWLSLSRCKFAGPVDYAVYIDNASPFVDYGDHSVVDCQFLPSYRDAVGGIYHQNSGGFKMVNSKVNHGGDGPYRFDYGYHYDGNAITPDIQISNCSFENFDVKGIYIHTNTFTDTKNITITGNQFGLSSSTGIMIDIDKIQYGTIMGNTLRGNGGGSSIGIRVQNSEGITLLNQYSNFAAGNNFVSVSNTNVIDLSPYSGSATLDFADKATLTSETLTITVTGAAVGDVVNLGVPNGSMTAGLIFFAWVSAANTVSVQCYNSTTGSINPASGTFKATIQSKF